MLCQFDTCCCHLGRGTLNREHSLRRSGGKQDYSTWFLTRDWCGCVQPLVRGATPGLVTWVLQEHWLSKPQAAAWEQHSSVASAASPSCSCPGFPQQQSVSSELQAEIHSLLPKLLVVKVFHHSNGNSKTCSISIMFLHCTIPYYIVNLNMQCVCVCV